MREPAPDWRTEVRSRLRRRAPSARAQELAPDVQVDPSGFEDRVEELAQHLELRHAELRASGLAEADAVRQTLAELGEPREPGEPEEAGPRADPGAVTAESAAGGFSLARDAGPLVHGAWRALACRPAHALLVAGTLALGVGTSVALFAVVDTVLLRPLPYPEPDRLLLLWGTDRAGGRRGQVSSPDLADFASQAPSLEAAGPFRSWRPILGAPDGSDRVPAMLVGRGYFAALGARPQRGRLFSEEEQQDGRDDVVVLSDALWRGRFGADPGIVGRTIALNLRPHTVVGVLLPDAVSLPAPLVDAPAQLYRPLAEPYEEAFRDRRHLRGLARMKRGSDLASVQAELALVAGRLARAHPSSNAGTGVRVVRLADDLRAGLRRPLALVLAGSLVLLLIACVNAGHLMLAEGVRRSRETAVRLALGASPARLTGQALVEGLMLSGLGGLLGGVLAWIAVPAIGTLGAAVLPALSAIRLDVRSLAFALALSVLTGLLAALLPALGSWRVAASACLRSGSAPPNRGRTRRGLVVAEVALAMVLAIGAGLLVRSVAALWSVDPGFAWQGVSKVEVTLPAARYSQPALAREVVGRLDDALRALPGVASAGVVAPLPLAGSFDRVGFEVEGRPRPDGQELEADRYVVTPGALAALELRASAGRLLAAADGDGALPVVLVSESLARQAWPGAEPLGQRVRLPWNPGRDDSPWRTVVGVVRDVHHYGLDSAPMPQLYLPHAQYPVSFLTFVARSHERDTGAAASPVALRQAVRSVDPDLAPFDAATLESVLQDSIALRRFVKALMSAFALLAVVLAGLGLHGVVGQAAAERAREIGIRVALGARSTDVVRLVVGSGLRPVWAGLGLGLLGAAASTGLARGLLYGVSPFDLPTFVLVPAGLVLVALAACAEPAWRALRTDPLGALKQD